MRKRKDLQFDIPGEAEVINIGEVVGVVGMVG